jgi:large subunit ribosomal protein L29
MAKKTSLGEKLREHTPEELRLRLDDAKKELFTLRVRQTKKELENPHAIQTKRREIARILTVLTEMDAKSANA